MSENSFENSTYSENNSYDEASSNPPESLNSPSTQAVLDDDFAGGGGGGSGGEGGGGGGVYGPRLTADLLTSLPVLSTVSSASMVTAQTYRNHPQIKDADLSELLMRKQPKFTPQAPKCAKCTKNVYKAEEIRAANKTYHKLCFKCNACNKLLESNILTEHAGDLYCKMCYAKNFGPKGYGVGLAIPAAGGQQAESSTSAINGFSNNSTSSSSSVAAAPTMKWTFSSAQQQQQQPQSTQPQQQPDRERQSLPQTKNGGSTHISSAYNQQETKRLSLASVSGSVAIAAETNKCARCSKSVYAAERVAAAGKIYHKLCFNCTSCKKLLNSMNCCDNSDGDIFCKACYGKQYGPKGVGYGIGAGALQTSS